jgi:hypothetical protein
MFRFTTIFVILGILSLLLLGAVAFLILNEKETSETSVQNEPLLPYETTPIELEGTTTEESVVVPNEEQVEESGLGTDLNMEFPTLEE